MKYLVTRPEPGATDFAAALCACGYDALVAPLFDIRFIDGPPLDLAGVDALVVTSANAVTALGRRCNDRAIPLLAIGPQTAEAARQAGFTQVQCADGDRFDLMNYIARDLPGGKLLHVCGVEAPALSVEGSIVRRVALYESIAVDVLPGGVVSGLRAGTFAGVFFFSPRAATVFATLAERAQLERYCVGLDAYCISAAAAKFLTPLPFAQICIAARPNRAAMLDMMLKRSAQ